MKLISKTKNLYTLRLDSNEEFISSVQNFCASNNIKNGWLEAIGSTKELELAYFNVEKKQYDTKLFTEFLEIIIITGNISRKLLPSSLDGSGLLTHGSQEDLTPKEGLTLHAHGAFSRSDMSLIAGHVKRCVISATAEIILHVGKGEIKREFDDKTGLYLLN